MSYRSKYYICCVKKNKDLYTDNHFGFIKEFKHEEPTESEIVDILEKHGIIIYMQKLTILD